MIGIDIVLLFIGATNAANYFAGRPLPSLYQLSFNPLVIQSLTIILLMLYVGASLVERGKSTILRASVVLFLGIFLIGSYLGIQIAARSQSSAPFAYLHDGAVQTEDAIAALRHGQNPYAIDYRDRAFGAFPESFSQATRENPAWTHYVYPPLHAVLGVPLAILSDRLIGWFDVRMLYGLAYVVFVVAAARLVRDRERRLSVLILAIFNPIFLGFFITGFNDILFLAWIALGSLWLQGGRYALSGAAFGLAVASKQTAWLLVPFFLMHLWFSVSAHERKKMFTRGCWSFALVAGALMLPFFIWSPSNFIDDVLRFGTGSAALSYPISGLGFSQILLSLGAVASQWDYYPFWIWQAMIGIPLLIALSIWQKRQPTVGRMLAAYGLFAFIMLFVSRYFNDSYINVFSMVFLLAFAAWQKGEEQTV